ncbi:polysaccharide deacetylase family protein [Methanofollis aquaemaris]|nr:polysaccharide deacetylase family protein [Methanofollis aquaemaris]
MDLEECYGGSSTFFFLALEDGDPDHAFNIEDLEGEIGTIINRGWEVGLHGGHDAYNNPEKIREEKKRLEDVLGRPPVGYRNHYLRFRVPETWEYIREAGFKYDTTFGYADCIGFRNGMCHPFIPYNLSKNQSIDLLEIPLAIMDCTFDLYMKLDASQAWEITKQVIDTVEQCHGVMTILWHNTYMRGEQLRMYHKILDYCSGKDAWLTNGAALCNHFMRD